jgi:hypothetical protein
MIARGAIRSRSSREPERPIKDPLTDFMTSRQGRALQREIVRGVFGLLRKRL